MPISGSNPNLDRSLDQCWYCNHLSFMFAHLLFPLLPPPSISETIYQDTSAVRIQYESGFLVLPHFCSWCLCCCFHCTKRFVHMEQSARNQFVYWKSSRVAACGWWIRMRSALIETKEGLMNLFYRADSDLCHRMCQRLSFHPKTKGSEASRRSQVRWETYQRCYFAGINVSISLSPCYFSNGNCSYRKLYVNWFLHYIYCTWRSRGG